MRTPSEITRLIEAIHDSDFDKALSIVEKAKRPNSLISTATLFYLNHIGLQLGLVGTTLSRMHRVQLGEVNINRT